MEKRNQEKKETDENRRGGKALPIIKKWAPAIVSGIFSIAVPLIVNITMSSLTPIWQVIVIAIAVGAFLIISSGCWIVTAICEAREKSRNVYEQATADLEGRIESLDSQKDTIVKLTNGLATTIDSLQKTTAEFVKSNDLFEQILDGEHVAELEASVGSYDDHSNMLDIYILASSFTLEQADGVGALLEPIVWNLRKGVTYHYLIPYNNSYIDKYSKMLHGWYKLYSSFLESKEAFQVFSKKYLAAKKGQSQYAKYWSQEYTTLVESAKNYWDSNQGNIDDLREQCKNMFKSHIITHVEEQSLFFVTVAAYENKKGDYDAIIKIPTENPNEKYYALRVSEVQIEGFMRQFRALYKSEVFEASQKNFGCIYSLSDRIFD